MKKIKKLNSIATMSEEELQEVNGGMSLIYYPKIWIYGMPAPLAFYNSNQGLLDQGSLNQGLLEKNAGMNIGIQERSVTEQKCNHL